MYCIPGLQVLNSVCTTFSHIITYLSSACYTHSLQTAQSKYFNSIYYLLQNGHAAALIFILHIFTTDRGIYYIYLLQTGDETAVFTTYINYRPRYLLQIFTTDRGSLPLFKGVGRLDYPRCVVVTLLVLFFNLIFAFLLFCFFLAVSTTPGASSSR